MPACQAAVVITIRTGGHMATGEVIVINERSQYRHGETIIIHHQLRVRQRLLRIVIRRVQCSLHAPLPSMENVIAAFSYGGRQQGRAGVRFSVRARGV